MKPFNKDLKLLEIWYRPYRRNFELMAGGPKIVTLSFVDPTNTVVSVTIITMK